MQKFNSIFLYDRLKTKYRCFFKCFHVIKSTVIKLNYFYFNPKGIIYVMIPEGQRDFEWIEGLLEKKKMTNGYYKGYR